MATRNQLAAALNALADAVAVRALVSSLNSVVTILEARGEYTYEEINEKRFVADADACDICQDAADLGWIGDDETFEGVFGDEDGPPLHPHCGCGLEYRERRVRVYV